MRKPLDIPDHLIAQAQLYAPARSESDAVSFLISDYPRLLSELRSLRRRLSDFDTEAKAFDERLAAVAAACESLLELSR